MISHLASCVAGLGAQAFCADRDDLWLLHKYNMRQRKHIKIENIGKINIIYVKLMLETQSIELI